MARGYSTARSEQSVATAGGKENPYATDYRIVTRGRGIKALEAKLEEAKAVLASLPDTQALQEKQKELMKDHITEVYYGSDGWFKEWKPNTPRPIIDEVNKIQKELEKYGTMWSRAESDKDQIEKEIKDINDAKLRAKEFFPELPNVPRDSNGYHSLKQMDGNREGRAQLSKVPQEELAQMKRKLIREVVDGARLEGEDSGAYKGQISREVKFGKFKLKLVADVEYRNDPYGDSNTDLGEAEFYIGKA